MREFIARLREFDSVQLRELINSLRQFDLAQLRDLERLGSWPLPVRTCLWLIAFVCLLAAGYLLHVAGLAQQLHEAQAQETRLRAEFARKHGLAAHLPAYQSQQLQLQAGLAAALRQLPADAELSGLIEDITRAGAAEGLRFDSIDLQPETLHGFYVEKPIALVVRGDYHSLGAFLSALAALPRLVTLHDFTLEVSAEGRGGPLVLRVEARTYRHKEAPNG